MRYRMSITICELLVKRTNRIYCITLIGMKWAAFIVVLLFLLVKSAKPVAETTTRRYGVSTAPAGEQK